jgi:hypothetical protein
VVSPGRLPYKDMPGAGVEEIKAGIDRTPYADLMMVDE